MWLIRTASGNAYIYHRGDRSLVDWRHGRHYILLYPNEPEVDARMILMDEEGEQYTSTKVTEVRK